MKSSRMKMVIATLVTHQHNIDKARIYINELRLISENLPARADSIFSRVAADNSRFFMEEANESADFCYSISGTTRRRSSIRRIVVNRLIRLQRDVNGARLP